MFGVVSFDSISLVYVAYRRWPTVRICLSLVTSLVLLSIWFQNV